MTEGEKDNIPEESKLAQEHIDRAKAAKVFGDDATAEANIRAAWVRIQEALEKRLKEIGRSEEG